MAPTKGRFDSLDVQAMVAHLQHTLCGRRIANIYDGLTSESFILKLDGVGGGGQVEEEDNDKFLLLESGVRFHTISHFSAESTMPSPTAAKLRKHLRGTRIEKVSQIGQDRVVMFQCGVGVNRHALLLELYSKGNLILTDANYTVLALLRSHVFESAEPGNNGNNGTANNNNGGNTGVAVQVGQVYPVAYATNVVAVHQDATAETTITAAALNDWAVQCLESSMTDGAADNDDHDGAVAANITASSAATTITKKAKKKKNKALTLKMLLSRHDSKFAHLGPALIEHCLRYVGLPPNDNLKETAATKRRQDVIDDVDGTSNSQSQVLSAEQWTELLECFHTEAPRILATMGRESGGYILYRPRDEDGAASSLSPAYGTAAVADPNAHTDKVFEEFLPVLLKQHEHRPSLAFANFSKAVATYFDRFQIQKNLQKTLNSEKAAKDKVSKVRLDQQERLDALREQQELWQREASTVQRNAEDVDKALAVINSALDSGMDWQQLEQVVMVEQQNQNPIALLIHQLVLDDDAMILLLPSVDAGEDGDETMNIKILLKETAHGNANRLFTQYRNSKEKASKTIEAAAKALKAAEESAKRQMAEAQKKSRQHVASTTTKHRPSWFEKFRWFITTDNYLVLGGRDAHQNEQLVKRYLRPGDAYLHADVFGAASCILRAKRQRRKGGDGTNVVPLSEQALREAGHFTICQSSAWTSRMVTSAWWVESHQVSKTPPAGEFLTVGAFMIRGKKNYLPPSPLEMGLGVLFRLGDEASIARHQNDRRDFALLTRDDDDDESAINVAAASRNTNHTAKANTEDDEHEIEPSNESGDNEAVDENDTPNQVDDMCAEPTDLSQPSSVNQYEQEDNAHQDSKSEESDTKSDKGAEKRGLSVRERKLIKKYGSLEAAKLAQEEQGNAITSPGQEKKPETTPASENRKRGKKTKQKRAQRKYADQDEEDKELAMLALQGGKKARKKTGKGSSTGAKAKTGNEAKQDEVAAETAALLSKDPLEVAARLPDDVRAELASCITTRDGQGNALAVKWEKLDAETLEQLADLGDHDAQLAAARRLKELKETKQVDNFSASLGGIIRAIRKYGHESMMLKQAAEDTKEKAEPSEPRPTEPEEHEPDQIDLELDAVDDTAELYRLTGKPVDGDVLISAVPVCAPYHTLSQYTFRIKLTPGNLKRGKAAKQCLEIFTQGKQTGNDQTKRQIDLIKQTTDSDWVNAMSGDVKIAAPGVAKIGKKLKAQKKKAVK